MTKKCFLFAFLSIIIASCTAAEKARKDKDESVTNAYTADMNKDTIDLACEGKPILSYRHSIMDVPAGVDPLFKKSGFIHPLYSPAGKVLTRIQAPDHYHHYGIWGPWTKTTINGQEVDFWNLAKGEGTVRFAEALSVAGGPQSASLKVRQEHVMFKPAQKIAINEILLVSAKAASIGDMPVWVIDYTSTFTNVLDVPIVLNDYRYGGGIGFRATADWTKDNCAVLTSEGKTRVEADGTRARWCDIRGAASGASVPSGILFLSHTANQDHPEPMRVWPMDANQGRGDMFFEFCPIRLNPWTLEPAKEYVLRYRMIVYDGTLEPQKAEELWKQFVQVDDAPN